METEKQDAPPRHRGRPPKTAVTPPPVSAADAPHFTTPETHVHDIYCNAGTCPDFEGGDEAGPAEVEDAHEQEIRELAVSLKLMDASTAQVMPFVELEEMVNEARADGLGKVVPAVDVPAVEDAVAILRGMLELISVKSANQMPMGNVCKRCEGMPDHLKKDCVCKKARYFIAQYATKQAPSSVPNL